MCVDLAALSWSCMQQTFVHEPCLAGALHVLVLRWQQLMPAELWAAGGLQRAVIAWLL